MNNRMQNLLMWGILLTIPFGLLGWPAIIFLWALIIGGIWVEYKRDLIRPETMNKYLMSGRFSEWFWKVYGKDIEKAAKEKKEEEKDEKPEEPPKPPNYFGLDKMGLTPEEFRYQMQLELIARSAIASAYSTRKTNSWKLGALMRSMPKDVPVYDDYQTKHAYRMVRVKRMNWHNIPEWHIVGIIDYGTPNEFPLVDREPEIRPIKENDVV